MPQEQSPFEIVTPSKPKKIGSKGLIIALIVVMFLALGIFAGVMLVRQRQEIREKAAVPKCPQDEQCPVTKDPTHLRTCDKPDPDNSPDEQLCNKARARKISTCGGVEFCCPAPGQAWTKDLTKCPASSPSPSASATATATATATSTSTSTAKATATATATSKASATAAATASPTKAPIPETGTGWPTIVGAGLGILVIMGSLLLAL